MESLLKLYSTIKLCHSRGMTHSNIHHSPNNVHGNRVKIVFEMNRIDFHVPQQSSIWPYPSQSVRQPTSYSLLENEINKNVPYRFLGDVKEEYERNPPRWPFPL